MSAATGRTEWQAYCRYISGSGWFRDGWYSAVDEDHARLLSADGKIRSRIVYPSTEWVEQ